MGLVDKFENYLINNTLTDLGIRINGKEYTFKELEIIINKAEKYDAILTLLTIDNLWNVTLK